MLITDTKHKIITYSFCDSFKDKLAEYIRTEYEDRGADLSKLAIIFGGKRPALFLKRDLAKCFGGSFYPPRFFTIDEFVQYTVERGEPFARARDLDHCYLLYQTARKVTPHLLKGRETFARFLPWTREILKFIDQLDLDNIDESALKNIQSNAAIGYDVPADINRLLESVVILRRAVHKELMARRTYSRGLQYLRAAQLAGAHAFDEFDQVLFCNFFYFHRTEEAIVKSLYERDKATLIFQGDERRWPVLKRISKMLAHPIREGEEPLAPRFDLGLHAGHDVHSQVAMVREILKEVDKKENTVIVLPDPDHVIPLLSEIAVSLKDYNVSMGYPLRRSSCYTLFDLIFRAQMSARDGRYYTRDYLKVLKHPFVKNLKLSANATVTRILVHKLEEVLTGKATASISGSLFLNLTDISDCDDIYSLTKDMLKRLGLNVKKGELKDVLQQIHGLCFVRWEGIGRFRDLADALERFLDVLTAKSFMKNYPINLNVAARVYAIIEEFRNAAFTGEEFAQEELFRIFEEKLDHEFIRFEGSPLKGLQILGLLETRSLNFDHVIVLDVNEGTLPSLRVHEPLIPREVMISLGLDRLELEEEIQRYQFMRLISSAKHVHLVYQESRDKERSRFIEELIWDRQKKDKTMKMPAVIRPSFAASVAQRARSARKTPEMIRFLKDHTYSASGINMYLRDPYEFYTNYVLGLREQEDLLDEPEARHVGTFIHALLEEAFRPFVHKAPRIDQAFRDRLFKLFEERFEETFGRTMRSDAFLLKAVMAERLARFCDNEQNNGERRVRKVLYLEKRFDDVIALPAGKIRFRYVLDRVDELVDNTVMILDYKTGNADLMPKPVGQIRAMDLSRENIRDHVRSFQIPLYCHYLNKQYPGQPVNAGLYSLKTMTLTKFIDPSKPVDRKAADEAYLNCLNFILKEILDPDVPFEEDPDNPYK